jgi:hypothetical protein
MTKIAVDLHEMGVSRYIMLQSQAEERHPEKARRNLGERS